MPRRWQRTPDDARPGNSCSGIISGMSEELERHTYNATFNDGQIMDGQVRCPACEGSMIHPTGHTWPMDPNDEYGPRIGLVGQCECGVAVEIRLGNYKGHLGIDVVRLGW